MQEGYQGNPPFCVLHSIDHVYLELSETCEGLTVLAFSWGTHNAIEVKKKKKKEC